MNSGASCPAVPLKRVAAAVGAGMLRKSSSTSSSGGGGLQHTQALHRHSRAHTGSLSAGSTKTWDLGRGSKNPNPLSSMGLTSHLVGAPGVDPEYVMRLVNDVRWFADVLLNLKEAFNCEGEFCEGRNVEVFVQDLWRSVK